jgi:CheY-like chemotaxis protein
MADLLWETDLTPDQRKYLRIFRRAGSSLLQLINDILDLSKVEAGHIELELIEFDLSDLVEKSIEILAMRANEKGLELACHLSPDVPCALIGDPNRLHQILVNLISNAIKFTDTGSVIVDVSNDPDQAVAGAIRFSVADTGIGIPQDKLSTIFERFTQAHASISRQYGGTGLGLTISKQLAELMGGTIRADSTPGQGSIFHCGIILGVASNGKMPPAAYAIDLHGLRALAVDDHPINRQILTETLSSWNAHVTAVGNGPQALKALRQAAGSAHPYGLLLVDCRMPDMDGFKVVETIRHSGLATGLTIIMLASDHWADDIARTYDMGLGGYLTKPIRRSDLLQTLSIALDRARGISAIPTVKAPALSFSSRPLHILLVEDSPDNQILVRSYLQATPYQLDVAEHGGIAVEQFKRGHYDVILMDMNMPVMDGYEATKSIRAWERAHDLHKTQIIALTALALKEEGEKILAAGCNAHMTKPIKRQTLLEVLQACEGQRRS